MFHLRRVEYLFKWRRMIQNRGVSIFIALVSCVGIVAQPVWSESMQLFRHRASTGTESNQWHVPSEIMVGRELANQFLSRYPLVNNAMIQSYVNRLGQGIVAMVGRSDIRYYFAVIDADHVNAYALPGGYVLVTSAMIDACKNEAQLVGVLAHELSHINRRYIVETYKIGTVSNGFFGEASVMIGGGMQTSRIGLSQLSNQIMQELLETGLDAKEELAADAEAVLFMQILGYDVGQYRELLLSFGHHKDSSRVSNTHPKIDQRLVVIQETNTKGMIGRDRFNAHVHQ